MKKMFFPLLYLAGVYLVLGNEIITNNLYWLITCSTFWVLINQKD